VEDDDIRLLLEKQATDPSTLKKVSELIKNMCKDSDYLDYNENPSDIFPEHEEKYFAKSDAQLPINEDDEDNLIFNENNEDETIRANQCKLIKDALLKKWQEYQDKKYSNKCELKQSEVKHFVREIEQKSNMIGFSISTPVSIKFKIDFEAEDDEGAVNKEQIQQ